MRAVVIDPRTPPRVVNLMPSLAFLDRMMQPARPKKREIEDQYVSRLRARENARIRKMIKHGPEWLGFSLNREVCDRRYVEDQDKGKPGFMQDAALLADRMYRTLRFQIIGEQQRKLNEGTPVSTTQNLPRLIDIVDDRIRRSPLVVMGATAPTNSAERRAITAVFRSASGDLISAISPKERNLAKEIITLRVIGAGLRIARQPR